MLLLSFDEGDFDLFQDEPGSEPMKFLGVKFRSRCMATRFEIGENQGSTIVFIDGSIGEVSMGLFTKFVDRKISGGRCINWRD